MANYDFIKDLALGIEGEDVVINHLETLGAKFICRNNDNKFDVCMEYNNENLLYEIKTDVFCKPDNDTGNLFVEFECRDKPSGIEVTQAKWFVTYFKHLNEMWYIKTQTLKDLLKEYAFNTTYNSGDTNSFTRGYLIPRDIFKDRFKIYEKT